MLRKPRVSAAWAMSTARAYISGEGRADGDCISRKVPNLMVMSPSPRRSERGMGKTGRLHAKRVHGGARGEKERPEIRPAEGEIGGHLGSLDDAEPFALGGKHPRAPGAGAEDVPLRVHLHAVGHAVRLVR